MAQYSIHNGGSSHKGSSLIGSRMNKYSKGNFTNPLDNKNSRTKKKFSISPSQSEAVYLNPITNYRNLSTIVKDDKTDILLS